jgi:hypothetical protein
VCHVLGPPERASLKYVRTLSPRRNVAGERKQQKEQVVKHLYCVQAICRWLDEMKSSRTRDETDADDQAYQENVIRLVEELVAELRRMKKKKGPDRMRPEAAPEGPPMSGCPEDVLREGVRVRIVRKDQYYNRTGVVMHRHGRLFWDVRLDATSTRCASVIYKKDASLCVIGPV